MVLAKSGAVIGFTKEQHALLKFEMGITSVLQSRRKELFFSEQVYHVTQRTHYYLRNAK